jgi:serine protease Do
MSIDRRSFRIGMLTSAVLMVGIVIGVAFTIRANLVATATSNTDTPVVQQQTPVSDGHAPNFPAVVRRDMPAVVNISTTRVVTTTTGLSPMMQDPFFRHFFGDQAPGFQGPQKHRESALGSGVIVDPNGYIVTNNHVIAHADEIKVLLGDGRKFKGKVIGTDPKTDIAVVKINAHNLPTIPWGDSDKIEVGGYVLAIGNPFGLNQTVTMGIISAKGRANVGIADYEDFIQTDAAINPGNSGGALVNARGQLIGINTAIFSRSGGFMGIGFAVPSDMARSVMNSLIKYGKVTRGWLGVSIQKVTPELAKQFHVPKAEGALVSEIMQGTPASHAGLKSGDVIVEFDGHHIDNPTTLRNVVAATKVGKTVRIKVIRAGKTRVLKAKISQQPKNIGNKMPEESSGSGGAGTALAGVQIRSLTPQIANQLGISPTTAGVVVTQVNVGSAAEEAGLRAGDVILEINQKRITSVADFKRQAHRLGKKGTAVLLINRRGNQLFLPVSP